MSDEQATTTPMADVDRRLLRARENIFFVDKDEMYNMNCNIFSISEDTVVSEKSFERLNNWLEKRNINVEKIKYSEISKQEGLLRCSTMPLIRE